MTYKESYSLLFSSLRNIIQDDYVLLDIPYYTNVGDVLIWQATLDLFKKIRHKCLYSSSIETYKKPKINNNVIIVFSGGGNFGDLWGRHQDFRHRVLEDFPNNPVVQLPQSVWFESQDNLNKDIDCYKQHKGTVTICLRDQQSYDIISTNYPFVNAQLLPDLVLSLNIKRILRRNRLKWIIGEGTLLFKRKDKEAVQFCSSVDADAQGDWPCMEYTIKWERKYNGLMDWCYRHHIRSRIQRAITKWYYRYILKDAYIRNGIKFIMPYRTIYATRLHAAILADLLGKQVYMIDNSYKKCSGVYNLWMKDHKNVTLL